MRISDLRGIAQLAAQATTGVVRVVEGVHASVVRTVGLPAQPDSTSGVSGFVYRSVRGITRGIGAGTDLVLGTLQARFDSMAGDASGSSPRTTMLAVLNGVLGDHLAASGNPLAWSMTLRHADAPVFSAPIAAPTRKLLVLVHGLCMHDGQWRTQRDGRVVDHGEMLAAQLGYTPVHVRYNTGLHIAQNGSALSAELERLCARWPEPVDELAIVAHSMGGLVARSACHHAERDGSAWRARLKHLVFLGTPHHGAPLERAGHAVDLVLGSTPWSAPFAQLGQVRSAGITDLRHGAVLDPGDPGPVLLPAGVACYTIAASTATQRGLLADHLVGDGLVPLRSALGEHDEPVRDLGFPRDAQWTAWRTGHLALLSSPEVGERIAQWLGAARTQRARRTRAKADA